MSFIAYNLTAEVIQKIYIITISIEKWFEQDEIDSLLTARAIKRDTIQS